jgi:predicted transcriptional regulator
MAGTPLPPSELAVLQVLWERRRATAREVRETLAAGGRRLTHSTIVTLLTRLENKGFVAHEKAKMGKAFLFRPTRRREGVWRGFVEQLVHRVFGGDAIPLFSCLIEEVSLRPDQIKELKRMVKTLEEPHRGGKSK